MTHRATAPASVQTTTYKTHRSWLSDADARDNNARAGQYERSARVTAPLQPRRAPVRICCVYFARAAASDLFLHPRQLSYLPRRPPLAGKPAPAQSGRGDWPAPFARPQQALAAGVSVRQAAFDDFWGCRGGQDHAGAADCQRFTVNSSPCRRCFPGERHPAPPWTPPSAIWRAGAHHFVCR